MGAQAHVSSPSDANWTAKQAYLLAAFCLVLGVALGYLFRGSASPAVETAPAATSDRSGANGGESGASPSPQQQAEMTKQAVGPLLARLEVSPNDFDAIVNVANTYYDGQQYVRAIPYYERALKVRAEDADVRTDLGTSLWYSGDPDRAIAEFEKALQYQPDRPSTLFNLGVVRWQGKADPKGAIQAWEELLRRNPNHPQRQQVLELIARAKEHAKG